MNKDQGTFVGLPNPSIPEELAKRNNINNAFDYLLNAISIENLQKSRELSIVITNIEQAKLWFTKVDTSKEKTAIMD